MFFKHLWWSPNVWFTNRIVQVRKQCGFLNVFGFLFFFTLFWWFTLVAIFCLVQCDKQHPWKNCSAGQVFFFFLLWGRLLPFLPSDNQFLKDYFPFSIHSFFAILETEIWDTHHRFALCVCVCLCLYYMYIYTYDMSIYVYMISTYM